MYQYKDKKVFPLNAQGEKPTPFVVEKNEEYKVVPLGYIDPKNPSGDAIYNPEDVEKVIVTELATLSDGTRVYNAINNCSCGVHIEVYKNSQK